MAQRFDELFTEEEKARVFEECHSAPFSGHAGRDNTFAPCEGCSRVWYSVGIDLIEAPTTSQNGNRFLLSHRCKRPLYKLCDSLLCVK